MKKVFAFAGTLLPIFCASLLTGPKAIKVDATDEPIQYIGDLYQIQMDCSSSHRCHRSSHRGSTWSLLSRCKYKYFF